MVVKLKIAEAFRNDVGRGIVRVESKIMDSLGVSSGDIVEIIGKRTTAAIVWRGHPQDDGLGLIRLDGFTRYNCNAHLGDSLVLKKASSSEANVAEFAPTENVKISGNFDQYLKHRLMGRVLIQGDRVVVGVLGSSIPFVVNKTKPAGIVTITDQTQIIVRGKPVVSEKKLPKISYEDIGGLGDEIQKVREMIELPMKHPELFEKLGIEPPKGVLLYGPPGTGKTLLAKAVASEIASNFYVINGPEVVSKWYGQSEQNLRNIFKEAEENAPSIIFIDEIDAVAPKRSEVQGEVEKRIVAQLLTLLDGLESRGNVIVIGATNRIDAVDTALRRPGRFDREIQIGVPDVNGRREILQIHTRNMPLAADVKLNEIAAVTHGFVGADLESLSKEAALRVLRRILPKIDLEKDEIPSTVLENLVVKREDFIDALKSVEPSAMREVLVETPTVKWSDIGGLKYIKRELHELIELPIKNPKKFEKYGIKPPRGILLYGPPGCGKTLLARAVATESEANFISIRGPEVMSKWVGESEKAVREIFKKARQVAPCVVFFDELDALAPYRGTDTTHTTDRVLNQLLTEMDGIDRLERVSVVGATNRPDLIDPALLRPGRFDKLVLVGAPDLESRKDVFKIHTKEMPLDKISLDELSALTEGYSGADIEAVCREAALQAMRENAPKVTKEHFSNALSTIKPSVSKLNITSYESYKEALSSTAKGREPSYV